MSKLTYNIPLTTLLNIIDHPKVVFYFILTNIAMMFHKAANAERFQCIIAKNIVALPGYRIAKIKIQIKIHDAV